MQTIVCLLKNDPNYFKNHNVKKLERVRLQGRVNEVELENTEQGERLEGAEICK